MSETERAFDQLLGYAKRDVNRASKASSLDSIFNLWIQLEKRGREAMALARGSAENNRYEEYMFEAQEMLMRVTASIPSRSNEDIAYKLALWRRDAPELDIFGGNMQRCDEVVYSAFIDLVKTTGLDVLLCAEDIQLGKRRGKIL